MNAPETVATTRTAARRRGAELAAAVGLALVAGFHLGGVYADWSHAGAASATVAVGSELAGGPVPRLVGGPGRAPVETDEVPQPAPAPRMAAVIAE